MANDMILSDEQKILEQLAYYDARGVADEKIMRIFRCTSANLLEARKDEFYLEVLASETIGKTNQETQLDDSWDSLEAVALANLNEMIPSMMDPRTLLATAMRANQAGRRQSQHKAPGSAGSTINVDKLTADTKVVRLRSRFLERLSSDGGIERMVEREAIVQADGGGDMTEALNPKEVKALLQGALGVDTDNLKVKRHQGPDVLPGIEIDFGQIDMGEFDG